MARTITDKEYLHWLSDTTALRVVLGEIDSYYNGTVITHRVGTEFFSTSPTDSPPNVIYVGALMGAPSFTSRQTEAFGGATSISFGNLIIDNTDGRIDEWIIHSFAGRPVVLRIGSPDWGIDDFRVIFDGVSDRVDIPDDGSLEIYIKDKQRLLDGPIQSTHMNVADNSEGVQVPLCYGEVKNISPILDVDNENRYVIHESSIEGIDKVYLNGLATTDYVASLVEGYFTLNAEPTGAVTCDARGSNLGGYVNTIPGIAERLVERIAPSDAPGSASRLVKDWGTAVVGFYLTGRNNLLDVLDGIGTGFRYGFDRQGEFSFAPLEEPGTPVVVIDNIETYGDLGIIKGSVPVWKAAVGYRRNFTTQTSVDETVTDEHRAFVAAEFTKFAYSSDESVKVEHILAQEPKFVPSPILNEVDAVNEAERLLGLYSKQRYIATVSAYSRPLSLSIGDTLTLVDGRFGLGDGVNFVVIGITEKLIDSKVDLELWR